MISRLLSNIRYYFKRQPKIPYTGKKLSIIDVKQRWRNTIYNDFKCFLKVCQTCKEQTIIVGYFSDDLFIIEDNIFKVRAEITKIFMDSYNVNKQQLEEIIKNVITIEFDMKYDVSCVISNSDSIQRRLIPIVYDFYKLTITHDIKYKKNKSKLC